MKLEKFIYDILQSPKKSFLVYLITFILFVLSIATFPTQIIKAKMLPSKDSDTFSIYLDLKDGSSINQTKEVTNCIASNLQKNENITNISINATNEIGNATNIATIAIIMTFIPMFFVGGMMGQFMHPLPVFVPISLAMSLFVAYAFTPYLVKKVL